YTTLFRSARAFHLVAERPQPRNRVRHHLRRAHPAEPAGDLFLRRGITAPYRRIAAPKSGRRPLRGVEAGVDGVGERTGCEAKRVLQVSALLGEREHLSRIKQWLAGSRAKTWSFSRP